MNVAVKQIHGVQVVYLGGVGWDGSLEKIYLRIASSLNL
jgi:hypothetical protein